MTHYELGRSLGVLFASYLHDVSALAIEVRKLFSQTPEDELAQVRADITRTAAVAMASRPIEIAYPQGIQQIAGNAQMHFSALIAMEGLLACERELMGKVQP